MFGPSLSEMVDSGRTLTLSLARETLSTICDHESCRVLDVGCGEGRFLRDLLHQRPGVSAVGVDPYGLDRESDGIRFLRLGAERLDGMLERFDLLVTSMSLHHFPDVASFLRAAWFVTRWQSGRLLIVDWKQGVDTGIPEAYFSIDGVCERLDSSGWSLELRLEDRWHFAILARPRRFRFAVALGDDDVVARGMLGTAPRFALFDCTGSRIEQVELRDNPYVQTRQHRKTLDVARFLSDASLLVASRIGPRGQDRLRARGIRMLLTGRPVPLPDLVGFLSADFESGASFAETGVFGGLGDVDLRFL